VIEIKGLIESSLIEWEGKIAAVVFLPGCNFRCPWCHVPDLAFYPERLETIPFSHLKKLAKTHRGWLDGVVISGGEPTIHRRLPQFIEKVRKLGLPVKLETNGSYPDMLKTLIAEKLITSVAMDIKAPLEPKSQISNLKSQNYTTHKSGCPEFKNKYEQATGVKVDIGKIRESVSLLVESGIDYEFRTTLVPGFVDEEDIKKIAELISPRAKKYILQQFSPKHTFKKELRETAPYSVDVIERMAAYARSLIPEVAIR
jgi:pyruvate formate lyase activating enzyme